MKTIQKIINIAKKLKKEAPNKFAKWTDYVKAASKQIKTKSEKTVSGKKYPKPKLFKPTKKQTKKAAQRLVKQSHKDTNSHNVKLSIYSGTGLTNKEKSLGYIKPTRSSILKELEGAKAHLDHLTAMYKDRSYSKHKAKIKRSISKQNKHIGNILESL
jgi:hypothetical protein